MFSNQLRMRCVTDYSSTMSVDFVRSRVSRRRRALRWRPARVVVAIGIALAVIIPRSSPASPPAHVPELPAAVKAVVALQGDRGLVCSGVLVAPRVVLTARHCLPVREVRFGIDPRAPDAVSKVKAQRTPPLAVLDIALLELNRRHHGIRSFSCSGSRLVRTYSRLKRTFDCSFAMV